jgi:hypothetical protein
MRNFSSTPPISPLKSFINISKLKTSYSNPISIPEINISNFLPVDLSLSISYNS